MQQLLHARDQLIEHIRFDLEQIHHLNTEITFS